MGQQHSGRESRGLLHFFNYSYQITVIPEHLCQAIFRAAPNAEAAT
jgi:hypothetical protein